MADASPAAYRFAMFILSPPGQRILAKDGFHRAGAGAINPAQGAYSPRAQASKMP